MLSFKVPTELTVYTAAESLQQFLACLDSEESVIALNLNHVEEVDGCGVQLLLYFNEAAQKQQKSLCIESPPEDLKDALVLLNLEQSPIFSKEEM